MSQIETEKLLAQLVDTEMTRRMVNSLTLSDWLQDLSDISFDTCCSSFNVGFWLYFLLVKDLKFAT